MKSTLICFATLSAIFAVFNTLAPTAYMDEIFHVPQTQLYCAGRFNEWNDKITTFPGLYLFGVAIFGATRLLPSVGLQLACDVSLLRFVNVLFATALFRVIYALNEEISGRAINSCRSLLLRSLADFLCPVMFFFHFLYYTDTGGTLFVLLAYLHVLRDKPVRSALFAALAVVFRQTNIVWAAFVAFAGVLLDAEQFRRQSNAKRRDDCNDDGDVLSTIVYVRRNWLSILRKYVGFIVLALAFVVFVVVNEGSFVVGDKAHHVAALHLAMWFYFAAFAAAHLGFTLLGALIERSVRRQQVSSGAIVALAGTALAVYVMRHYSAPHAFTLADNRHYVFYVWRRVLDRHGVRSRELLAPLFGLASAACWMSVRARRSALWASALFVTSLVLVLTPLLEPRYFAVPLMFLRLHQPVVSDRFVLLDVVCFALVNVVTLKIFLFDAFVDPNGDIGHFMW